ncbi:BZ3500_MvSof-1268-A1-R1_Chr9g10639 [Microbotryum saponariae]|uniref:BZ3500_MvSof-1268-A1-R1_Chr9g10639 protein n=1 Tax=Microbotryum saponariae TaxID=289078 RepID=A0A2X0KUL6_9BASI|nr:BZ3501_MvSof-1269-A2-R1_Chr9g10387 [Microbotryum saponariae]SDA00434.1 BZ3500_MvSof-1268-A1-R1_Chr9g10639 [Microbotryum saponariae]
MAPAKSNAAQRLGRPSSSSSSSSSAASRPGSFTLFVPYTTPAAISSARARPRSQPEVAQDAAPVQMQMPGDLKKPFQSINFGGSATCSSSTTTRSAPLPRSDSISTSVAQTEERSVEAGAPEDSAAPAPTKKVWSPLMFRRPTSNTARYTPSNTRSNVVSSWTLIQAQDSGKLPFAHMTPLHETRSFSSGNFADAPKGGALEHTCSWVSFLFNRLSKKCFHPANPSCCPPKLHQWEHARALHQGLPQSSINWETYTLMTQPPNLKLMVDHLQSLVGRSGARRFDAPKESLWSRIPEQESLEEMQAAFKLGTIHFTGDLTVDAQTKKLVVRLCPAHVGMGSNIFRRYGSDRFFRLKIERKLIHTASLDSDSKDPLRSTIQQFFHHPINIFGRQYFPFCHKDDAMIYWCASGPRIPTISLIKFCQNVGSRMSLAWHELVQEDRDLLVPNLSTASQYIDVNLNHSMSVAKWAARFELGLTPTIPTVVFPRAHVLRIPDLMSDSLTVSYAMMHKVYTALRDLDDSELDERLPPDYLPSAIRGTYEIPGPNGVARRAMVWRLDYNTCPHIAVIQSTPPGTPLPAAVTGPSFVQVWARAGHSARFDVVSIVFEMKMKDGRSIRTEMKPARGEVEYLSSDNPHMTSEVAMSQIAEKLTAAEGDGRLLRGLPPAAQGRLGPGKGVWTVVPLSPWGTEASFIEVRDSQWKFDDAQTQRFTFELHSIPSPRDSAKLGKQTFEVLAHCGVPVQIFRELLKKQLQAICDPFFEFKDLGQVLYHIEKTTRVHEERLFKARSSSDPATIRDNAWEGEDLIDDVEVGEHEEDSSGFVLDGRLDASSGAPNTILELVVEMIQAGFSPDGTTVGACPPLGAKLDWIAQDQIKRNTSFKLTSEQCRTALVVADHLGLLNEGEIFFQASEAIQNGSRFSNVVAGDVLVTRPPAIQPCDVQKFKAVFYPEFRNVYDLIILPSKGKRAACSVLSGGDYDGKSRIKPLVTGDKLLIITDPTIVEAFDASKADPSFADPPFRDAEFFAVDRRKVSNSVLPLINQANSNGLSRMLISGLFQDARFGQLSKLHTKLAYSLGLDHPKTRLFGHLFARALDGRKQGLSLNDRYWPKIQAQLPPGLLAPEWTEREEGRLDADLRAQKFATRPVGLGKHVMDELVKEGRLALDKAPAKWREVSKGWKADVDEDLAGPWRREWAMARLEQGRSVEGSAYYRDLEMILKHVKTAWNDYKMLLFSWARERDSKHEIRKAYQAPGSPSPKSSNAWKSSSKNQKEDLVNCSRRLWSILDGDHFGSARLSGLEGAKAARTLIASCCYLEPLMPEPSTSSTSLFERLKAVAPAPIVSYTKPSSAPTLDDLDSNDEDADKVEQMLGVHRTSSPSPQHLMSDDISISGDSLFTGSQGEWEAELDRVCVVEPKSVGESPLGIRSDNTSRSSLIPGTGLVLSQTSETSTNATSAPSTSQASRPNETTRDDMIVDSPFVALRGPRPFKSADFREAGKEARFKFVYDMCHRDILGLKTDALWAKVHGQIGAARGIQGMKVAPGMLMAIKKSLAGITKAHSVVRPKTLLAPEPTSSLNDLRNIGHTLDAARASKRQKR